MNKASEWKKKARESAEVEELTLPSGMLVKCRRPGPIQLAYFRRLPLALAQQASGVEIPREDVTENETLETRSFFRELLTYCLVEPRVSLAPANDYEIHPRDIPEDDWKYIMAWAMRAEEAAKLAPFRGERPGDPTGSRSEVVEMSPIGADGDQGPGPRARL